MKNEFWANVVFWCAISIVVPVAPFLGCVYWGVGAIALHFTGIAEYKDMVDGWPLGPGVLASTFLAAMTLAKTVNLGR